MEAKSVIGPKRPDLVTLIAVYHFVVAALSLLIAGIMLIGLLILLTTTSGEDAVIGGFFVSLILLVVGVLAVVHVVTGWGLLKMKEWARWAAIAMGLLGLPNFPLGTVVGALAIWYLLGEGKQAFA
jgi:hypothetical protein